MTQQGNIPEKGRSPPFEGEVPAAQIRAPRPPSRLLQLFATDVLDGTGSGSEIVAAIPAGPPIARAENDVGGLLDTSKGWTLNIPMPSETGAATKAIADKQQAAARTGRSRSRSTAGGALATGSISHGDASLPSGPRPSDGASR